MPSLLMSLVQTMRVAVRAQAALHIEILALRHQLHALQRSHRRRVRLTQADRLIIDVIRKEGGNRFSGLVFGSGANGSLQGNDYWDKLR